MPKAKTTKSETRRPAPYNLRASTAMATTMVSPISPWHTPDMNWQHMGYPQMDSMIHSYPAQPVMPPQPTPQLHHPGQSAPWSVQEDEVLMNAKAAGLGWNEIHQRYFQTKSGNACRKRHERLMQKLRTTDWDDNRIRRVMTEYGRPGVREKFWGGIANSLGERWEDCERVVCQKASLPEHTLTSNSVFNKV